MGRALVPVHLTVHAASQTRILGAALDGAGSDMVRVLHHETYGLLCRNIRLGQHAETATYHQATLSLTLGSHPFRQMQGTTEPLWSYMSSLAQHLRGHFMILPGFVNTGMNRGDRRGTIDIVTTGDARSSMHLHAEVSAARDHGAAV